MTSSNPKNSLGNTIKLYLFPVLVTILASLIWRDVTEMRADIKALLAQSNIDKTDIQNLKKDVQNLETVVFNRKIVAETEPLKQKDKSVDLLADIRYFKPEEIFDISKYIPKS